MPSLLETAYGIVSLALMGLALIKLEKIMPTLAEVLASAQAEGPKIDAVLAAVRDENAKITDLSAQLTAALANQADPTVVSAIADEIAAHVAKIDAALPPAPAAPAA